MLVLLFEFQLSSGGYSVSIYGTGTDYAALLVICGTTGDLVIVVLCTGSTSIQCHHAVESNCELQCMQCHAVRSTF